MTQAIFLDEIGGPENFKCRALDLPPPGVGEIRVRHSAIGLNFIDIYQRKGLYPIALPAILGSEAAGVVELVGKGVDEFAAGDRVAWIGFGGGYAEAANIGAGMAAKIPDGVGDEAAAALFLKGLTVHMLARQIFPLGPDHTCLVHAAAGGVGTLLCQWASHLGARVIAVVGNDTKVDVARENGADDIIVRTQTKTIAGDVRKLTGGRGVDVVYDSVGKTTFDASLDSLAMRGHMITFGNASGPVPAVSPLDLSRRGSLTLTRPTLFHFATPDRLPAMAAELFEMLAKGALKPRITKVFPLDSVSDAHRLLEGGTTMGAVILQP